MKARAVKIGAALLAFMCCVGVGLPAVTLPVVSAATESTLTVGEDENKVFHPEMINQATGEKMDASELHFQPEIYLNDRFGTEKNAKVTSNINLVGKNNVVDASIPDAYEFIKVMVTSDPDSQNQTYTKEIEQIIKVGGSYYALIKGTQHDYLKFSNENQIKIVYNRYLRIGFEKSANFSDYIKTNNQIIPNLTQVTPAEESSNLNDNHAKNGFFVANSSYADGKFYYIPDFKSVQFARLGFDQVSQKSGSEESNLAMKTTANFYEFTNQTNTKFTENLNSFSMMNHDDSTNKNVIDYDYFVKHSGIVRLEGGIPSSQADSSSRFTLHFPANHDFLWSTTYHSSDVGYSAEKAIKRAMGDVTWAYITGQDAFPYQAKTVIDGKTMTNNYPISKGGTVVFTLQTTMQGLQSKYKYHSHLNRLVINGHNINLPISELRAKSGESITQQYSRTAYTYLPSGELVAVNYVPLPDGMTPSPTPWNNDSNKSPYYFVTIMNVQGNINIVGNKETFPDGTASIGNGFVFIQDGLGFYYSGGLYGYAPVSLSGYGLVLGREDTYNVSSILQVDHDLDFDTASIYSGRTNSAAFNQRLFPYGYFFDGVKQNGFGISKSRRLIVDNNHPLRFTVDKSSNTANTNINATDSTFMGRYFDKPNAETATTQGNAKDGYIAKFDQGKYWLDFKSPTENENYGATLYRVNVKDKHFKSFTVQFKDLSGNTIQNLSENKQAITNDPYSHIVFPRTNVSLTSSFDIDDFGKITALSKETKQIGTTSNGTAVRGSDESGFIVIPDLPAGATYYQLESVTTDGKEIKLSNKKYLPGQKVFTGQFLPEGTDFGNANGIDNGSTVTLKAVKVDPYNPDSKTSKAEDAKDFSQYATVDKNLYAGDKIHADHFAQTLGGDSPLGEGAYGLVDAAGNLTADKDGIYTVKAKTDTPDTVYTLKNFGDNSYEILATKLTISDKDKAKLTTTNQTIVDPLTQNASGTLEKRLTLATSTTPETTLKLSQTPGIKDATIGMDKGSVNQIEIPLSQWLTDANADNAELKVPFAAVAQSSDTRSQPLKQIRLQKADQAVPTSDSDTTPVTVTLKKADSPKPTVLSREGEKEVTVTFAKQPEAISGDFGNTASSSAYAKLAADGSDLKITKQTLKEADGKYTLTLELDSPLKQDAKVNLTYRYSARYNSTTTTFSPIGKIVDTGLKVVTAPYFWVLVLLAGGVVAYVIIRRRKLNKH